MLPFKEIVDLGHELYDGMPSLGWPTLFWPYDRHERLSKITDGKYTMESRMMLLSEHAGTHLDSPFHSYREGVTVDQIPLERLVVPGHLLDLRHKRPHEPIAPDDLEEAARRSGRALAAGTAVLVWTGEDRNWGAPNFTTDRPYVPSETVEWLASREPSVFGTDLIQVDDPHEWWYPTHGALARHGIPMVQQLCNLEQLAGKEFLLVLAPLKVRGGTASPVRPLALVTG